MSWRSCSLMFASVSPSVRTVDGARIRGIPRWLNSTSIVLRSQMARIARLQCSLDIIHTSQKIGVDDGNSRTINTEERHSRPREWPPWIRYYSTLGGFNPHLPSWPGTRSYPESLPPSGGG